MDVINLQKKNLSFNLFLSAVLVACIAIFYFIPSKPKFMRISMSIGSLICLLILLWSTFFIKNEIIFDKEKLTINRYKERFEFKYSEINSIKYTVYNSSESNNAHRITVRRHCLIISGKNSGRMEIELFGNVFIEDEINRLFEKYNLENM